KTQWQPRLQMWDRYAITPCNANRASKSMTSYILNSRSITARHASFDSCNVWQDRNNHGVQKQRQRVCLSHALPCACVCVLVCNAMSVSVCVYVVSPLVAVYGMCTAQEQNKHTHTDNNVQETNQGNDSSTLILARLQDDSKNRK